MPSCGCGADALGVPECDPRGRAFDFDRSSACSAGRGLRVRRLNASRVTYEAPRPALTGGSRGFSHFPGRCVSEPDPFVPYRGKSFSHGRREPDPDLRHDPARRRAIAGREHEHRREGGGGPRPRRRSASTSSRPGSRSPRRATSRPSAPSPPRSPGRPSAAWPGATTATSTAPGRRSGTPRRRGSTSSWPPRRSTASTS